MADTLSSRTVVSAFTHRMLSIAVAGMALVCASDGAKAQSPLQLQQFSARSDFRSADTTDEDLQAAPGVQTPEHLKRAVVAYATHEAPGTIVIDTGSTYLYFVLGQGRAIRYGVGVGREGFTWAGVQNVTRKSEWPDWIPPSDMIARQPYLPRFMSGGPGNPLGARAMYLGNSIYRIHGTNDPSTIGKFVSSGCIRMTNEDVVDLYGRVNIGTRVVVLPKQQQRTLDAYAAMPPQAISVTSNRQPPARSRVNPLH